MRISTKGEYGLKAMLDLALHHDRVPIQIREVAERQGIPQRYLEQLLLRLRQEGLVVSQRGAAGGYGLSRPPGRITVAEIIAALEGPIRIVTHKKGGSRDVFSALWEDVEGAIGDVLRISLEDLIARKAKLERGAMVYHI
ncbi:MAG: Rrf2 family transcriptional regulator [Candidatus Tectomicrobia bacterium]|uniref:Rrf2 family transcriptional regulator n=1 Tax=Tectimicrobiota bacterium TaxID=2528274 RepID=A0A932LZJ8_UNCTE|nr:Rrf2 family transcriptional regulator [Candidatus Tectomicrobia bacterium]